MSAQANLPWSFQEWSVLNYSFHYQINLGVVYIDISMFFLADFVGSVVV
jgi:hypothetical protein